MQRLATRDVGAAWRSVKSPQDTQVQQRSPAMAAKFTDHMRTVREWFLYPVPGGRDDRRTLPMRVVA